ncbi:MAG: methyltransferase [Deltaproteobacteria bacterium]|nr:methyltransferase [Deltaproteobacteria bacterium]
MPTHEVIKNKNGTTSLRELKSGEVMHSSVGPREEATLLYIEQSRLKARLLEKGAGELVLWDVGLGAATNALAAMQCRLEQAGLEARPLRILSFENDISGLRLALEHSRDFPFFEGLTSAAAGLLGAKSWQSPGGEILWQLFEGDFHAHAPNCAAPELIFFDFYSPKTVPELWNIATFELLHRACSSRQAKRLGTTLYTYSASTRVRVALLLAGFYVGYGRNTGAKNDTTVAATRLEDLEKPLDARWLERLERSHEPFPHDWNGGGRTEVNTLVRRHKQFG